MESLARMEPEVISDVYGRYSRFPTPVSAGLTLTDLISGSVTLSTEWSQSESGRGARLRYTQHWTLIRQNTASPQQELTVLPPSPCCPIQGELLSSRSPYCNYRAVVRETGGRQYLEIWGSAGLKRSVDLTALDIHGRVYEDAQFGCLAWSGSESRLLYVAEGKRSSAETPWSVPATPGPEPSLSTGGPGAGGPSGEPLPAGKEDQSVYWEDWGEGLTGKSVPVLCVMNVEKGTVMVLQGVPPHVSPGQALWDHSAKAVFFVGWWHEPFRLGLKFCTNRRSALFRLDLDGNCECLSGDRCSISSPRLSPSGLCLVYLQGEVFGPHSQCLSLMLYELERNRTSVLVDVVQRPEKGQFAGVYEGLASSCWSSDSDRVVFSTARRNWKELFMVDRRSKRITRLSNSEEFGSWKLLCIEQELMVVCCSSPNCPPQLRVAVLPKAEGEAQVNWNTVSESERARDLDWTVLDINPTPQEENPDYIGLDFGALLVKRTVLRPGKKKLPLVVFIHGGPHSQFSAEWNVTSAGLAHLGFAVLMVNYRGSTGWGQDSIQSLIGNIGNQDVKDVQRAVLSTLKSHATLDPQRVVVMGGSHGGFLACHLIGQYPDFYRACAVRNPVINAATLLGTSDIVDWRYSSVGLQYSYDQLPTPQALATMLQKSPIVHATQIKAPVLLMLGGKDRRVSPHQGLELYRALKSRGSPVRLLWYAEEGHSLARVDTQADCFLNVGLWFQQHLNMH